jgi:hypothetical protein
MWYTAGNHLRLGGSYVMEDGHMHALLYMFCCNQVGVFRKARVGTSPEFHSGILVRRKKLDSNDCSYQHDIRLRIDQDHS